MPSFLTPEINKQPSVSNLMQTINNKIPSSSNYISPSNTDNNIKPNDSITSSILSFLCLAFMLNVLPFITDFIRLITGTPRSYELVIDLDKGKEYFLPRY